MKSRKEDGSHLVDGLLTFFARECGVAEIMES